jgi:hypothetical protein
VVVASPKQTDSPPSQHPQTEDDDAVVVVPEALKRS